MDVSLVDLDEQPNAAPAVLALSLQERGGQGAQARPGWGASDDPPAAIREWARTNGHEVSDRGRISKSVMHAYQTANCGGSSTRRPEQVLFIGRAPDGTRLATP